MINLKDLKIKLLKKEICIYPLTLKIHSLQGRVNETWTLDSNKGKLLLHVGKNHLPKLQYQKAKRIFYLSKFLSKHSKIPLPKVLDFGKDSKGNVYTIEKFMNGKSYEDKKKRIHYPESLARIIAQLHQIKLKGAGYIVYKNEKIQTTHKDWHRFLISLSHSCLQEVYNAKKISKKEYLLEKSNIQIFFRKHKRYFEKVNGSLMHGDLTVGNILSVDKRINALIDWEFSCVGDPAWEFAAHEYLQGVLLDNYFSELRRLGLYIDERNFLDRISVYDVIKELVIANSLKETKYFKSSWQAFKKMIEERIII